MSSEGIPPQRSSFLYRHRLIDTQRHLITPTDHALGLATCCCAQAIPPPSYEGGFDAWDIDRLVELTANAPIIELSLSDIPEIDSPYWFQEKAARPTVRAIVEHFRLMEMADLAHPIIVGPDGAVLDGMHRVARALLEGQSAIKAVRLEVLPEPDYRNCMPDELPYD